tara:strand:+ start:440 stop:658 length:219 start_codon:yes stop_codon:yes gene_type:complete
MISNGFAKPIDIYNISNDNRFPPPNNINPLPPNIHPNMSPNTYYLETLENLYGEYNIPNELEVIVSEEKNDE